MKKSFKKAGAAVLSMAMLLSMGAVSLPVYAADPTPGTVTVSIPGAFKQGQGDSDYADGDANATNPNKYQYLDLDGVSSAKVAMYKVAELTGSGWQWSGVFDEAAYRPTAATGFTGFDKLLEQVGGVDPNKDNFVYSSAELQKLASYLERTVRNLKDAAAETESDGTTPTAAATAAKGKVDALFKNSQTLTPDNATVTIPGDPTLTMNQIGWYLLMTDTNESGVVIQPVLVSLKNGDQNPVKVSLKGTKIRIDKSIVDVSDKTDTVSDSKDTAVVAKDDVVTYQIKAGLPKYDSGVAAADITTFVIDDTADPGIKVVQNDTTKTVKVYLSEDGVLDLDANGDPTTTGKDYLLTAGADKDYTLSMKDNNNGFTVSLTGAQLKGTNAVTSTLDSIKTGENRTYQTMEGMYIIVRFDATVNEKNDAGTDYKFNRKYSTDGYISASDVTKAQFDAISMNEVISAINRGVYTADELESGAFTNANLTAPADSLVDVLDKKTEMINGVETLIYLDAQGHEVRDVNQAAPDTSNDGNGKYGDGKKHAEYVKTSGLRNRVRVLLARDKANDTNGNKNDAEMTYGNIYSTGGGSAKDKDRTKLFSVDVNFDKYTQELTLAGKITKDDLVTSLADMGLITLTGAVSSAGVINDADKAAAKAALTKLLLPAAADVTLEEANALTGEDATAAAAIETSDDDYVAISNATAFTAADEATKKKGAQVLRNKKAAAAALMGANESTDVLYTDVITQLGLDSSTDENLAKAISKVVAKENADRDATSGYKSTYKDKAVQNAAFKLSKVEGSGQSETLTTIGYAASDANGDLRVLSPATSAQYDAYVAGPPTTGADVGKIVLKITEGTGQSATTTYWYYKADSENAWKMLSEGTYQIEEVYAPAGYKLNSGAARFTIDCAEDTLSDDYTGEFSGQSDSDLFRNLEDRKLAQKPTVQFTFANAAGELQENIYNELADTLPATGGIGTVLFTAGGIAVVLMAGGLFVMYMKKRNSEEEE